MQIFAGVPPGGGDGRTTVELSTTAIFSVFSGYFLGNFRDKARVIMQDMQSLVGFSASHERITFNDPEELFYVKF